MDKQTTYAAFAGVRCVARGALSEVLPVLKERFERERSELVLVFEVETGRQVDFDLRGSLEEIMARETGASRGPGRPKLGVTSREVTLLPRHWEWLEKQPNGISAALRRLVEQAAKKEPGRDRARRVRNSLSGLLGSIAGDRPNYEEACRALFAGNVETFQSLISRWPKDIREFAMERMEVAARMEKQDSSGKGESAAD